MCLLRARGLNLIKADLSLYTGFISGRGSEFCVRQRFQLLCGSHSVLSEVWWEFLSQDSGESVSRLRFRVFGLTSVRRGKERRYRQAYCLLNWHSVAHVAH